MSEIASATAASQLRKKYLHFLDDIEDDLRTSYQEEIEETAKEAAWA